MALTLTAKAEPEMPAGIEVGQVRPFKPVITDGHAIRRMTIPDLMEMSSWLCRRLRERYKDCTDAQILGFLRGCITSNEYWFVRGEGVCALAYYERRPLLQKGVGVEFFAFSPDDGDSLGEMKQLYSLMASWAAHKDCETIELNRHSDWAVASMITMFGPLTSKTVKIAWLGGAI